MVSPKAESELVSGFTDFHQVTEATQTDISFPPRSISKDELEAYDTMYVVNSSEETFSTQLPHHLHSNMGSTGRVEGAFLGAKEERSDQRCKG